MLALRWPRAGIQRQLQNGGGGSAVASRSASSFGFVAPGPVAPRRHEVLWRESDRIAVWKHAGIPVVQDAIPEAARGRLAEYYMEKSREHDSALHSLQAAHPELVYVAAIADAMNASAVLSPDELRLLLTPPSASELAALETPAGRQAALRALRESTYALRAAAQLREEDALDSGEVDLAFTLPLERREALQAARSKELLLAALTVARTASLITFAQDALMPPAQRAKLIAAGEAAQFSWIPSRVPVEDLIGAGKDAVLDREMTAEEVRDFNHGESFAETKRSVLESRDRTTLLPRVRLPPPLHADAPSAALADAARLLDENASMSAEDKAYVLQYYADAMAGKEAAFTDVERERAAWEKPQPQWGVYDTDVVRMQDRARDALAGAGAFSRRSGYAFEDEVSPPASAGHPDINPQRLPLEAGEEVRGYMRAYDDAAAREIAQASAAVTEALERSMGLPAGKLNKGAQGPDRQIAAAKAKLAAAAAAAPAGGKGKDRRGAGAAPAHGEKQQQQRSGSIAEPPSRVSHDVAEALISSFFQRYKSGERLARVPEEPAGGHRFIDPPAEAPKVAAPATATKKKK